MVRARGPVLSRFTGGGNLVRGRAGGVSIRVTIRGHQELLRKLQQLDRATADEYLQRATLAGGDVLAEQWRAMVPIDDGDYRSSITAVASPGKKGATGLVYTENVAGLAESQQPRNYAPRLEFGSSRASARQYKRGIISEARVRSARPSLRPAFDTAEGRMVDALADELRDLIERAV